MITVRNAGATWEPGRAGMLYRDLIPGRANGRVIASHIRIPDAGPVPDWVHYHVVQFQMIYCYRGWVRVVYEDQGQPFVLEAGDCVLQPPQIRHRVLESSEGLEVVELAMPADHQTCADEQLTLPTADLRPEREFSGQQFVRHVSADATWQPWVHSGFECRDTGIRRATGGLASAQVVRPAGSPEAGPWTHDRDLWFGFVLRGTLDVDGAGELGAGDAFVIEPEAGPVFRSCSDDLELLEVTL